eukprot:363074-Chlamydomonas_euryale.AAC.1
MNAASLGAESLLTLEKVNPASPGHRSQPGGGFVMHTAPESAGASKIDTIISMYTSMKTKRLGAHVVCWGIGSIKQCLLGKQR